MSLTLAVIQLVLIGAFTYASHRLVKSSLVYGFYSGRVDVLSRLDKWTVTFPDDPVRVVTALSMDLAQDSRSPEDIIQSIKNDWGLKNG